MERIEGVAIRVVTGVLVSRPRHRPVGGTARECDGHAAGRIRLHGAGSDRLPAVLGAQVGWYASRFVLGVGVAETLLGVPESGLNAAFGAAIGVFALLIVYSDRERFGVAVREPET